MLIGYARVSTNEQDTTAQASALKAAGCERIFREKATGGRWNRPELQRLLDHLRKGDVLVVWKLDRLSRSLKDVLTIMERIQEAKAGFRIPHRGDRYHNASRPNDDADDRLVRRIRTSHA
jgi:DNA invertase Pin-like site-specific DNA recombinase